MSNLRMVENTENILMEVGNNFTLKNTIMWTNKIKDSGYKLDPVTIKTNESKNYSDGGNNVTRLTFRHSDYLVFEFKSFEPKAFNSVYVSYPHMYDCKDFFRRCMETISDEMYTPDGITMEAREVLISSAPLAKGKRMAVYPCKIERNDQLINGVTLLIGANEYPVDMDLSTFAAIADMIEGIDLIVQTNFLMMMTMLAMEGNGNSGYNSSSNGFNSSNMPTRRNVPNGGLGSSGGRSSGGFNTKRRESPGLNRPNTENKQHVENKEPQSTQSRIDNEQLPPASTPAKDPTDGNKGLFSMDNLYAAGGALGGASLGDIDLNMPADDLDF